MPTMQSKPTPSSFNSVISPRTNQLRTRFEHEREDALQRRFVVLLVVSSVFWFLIATVFQDGNIFTLFTIGLLVIVLPLAFLGRQRIVIGLSIIAYLAPLEPAIRLYTPEFRYNILQFLVPLWVLLILSRRGRFELTFPIILYAGYIILELVGLLFSESLTLARAVLVPSLATFFFLVITPRLALKASDLNLIWHGFLLGAGSLATLTGRIIFSDQTIKWTTQSNFQASGGMGPNQVSFMLCVAVFICLLVSSNVPLRWRWFYWGLAGLLAYLMILTFSRGGLYILTATIVLYFFLAQRPSARSVLAVAVTTLLLWMVFTFSAQTTQGIVVERYNDLETSNRITLIKHGWQIFLENPVLGVGTGNYFIAVGQEDYFGVVAGAHNEWIRAIAEHGILGLVLWTCFAFSLTIQAIRGFQGEHRALRLSLVFIALISMSYNGLKLIIQPYLVVLALTAFNSETTSSSLLRHYHRIKPRAHRPTARLYRQRASLKLKANDQDS